MPSQRPALYSSAIQHVLVLQEENDHRPPADNPPPKEEQTQQPYPWRVKDRMKTANGALVLCLNIGVDPPDVVKPNPCARLECWTEPNVENPHGSLQQIATALKSQYERWQGKARYKVAQDPTVRDLKQICMALRKAAKEERVLFHYNGHGVPKPTANGEIWVFNHNYTQYIPMNLFDLHDVLGSPSLFVFDCNSAGTIYNHFCRMIQQLDREWEDAKTKSEKELPTPPHRNTILLGACAEDQILPTNPKLPADLFTSCLTTPIKTVLRWFAERTCVASVTPEELDRIPGNLNIRQTPLGELNWIFTSVTDAIAWNVLPREQFKMLYRQDLLLASLMRNFLLAERIMRSYGCTPVSYPQMPQTHTHPLWDTFDYSMEQILCQLPMLIKQQEAMEPEANGSRVDSAGVGPSTPSSEHLALRQAIGNTTYIPSTFFEDQMQAFDVWLTLGPEGRDPPQELPIMLQVLLSPNFRIKALPLLSRYLQTGPVAVDLALSVGIFPYVRRLLGSPSRELQKELVFIWSKILALDSTCKADLVTEKGEVYFIKFLQPGRPENEPRPVYLAVALFVLSVVAEDYADRCLDVDALEACYARLTHPSPFVRRWACLCLTTILRYASHPAQVQALEWEELISTLRECVTRDPFPDVRAAATTTLSAIMRGTLKLASPHGDSESSSFGSKSEYQPNQPRSDISHHADPDGNPAVDTPPTIRRDSSDENVEEDEHASSLHTGVDNSEDIFTSVDDYLDAPVPEFTPYERDALLRIGSIIAEIARRESSVLIRREVAIAIARVVRYQRERFVRAAHITDIIGIDDSQEAYTDVERCEHVYRKLWTALSELAFDPHPVIAKLARRSYDSVSDLLLKRTSVVSRFQQSITAEDISPTDHVFSPQNSSSGVLFEEVVDNVRRERTRSAPRRIAQPGGSRVEVPSPLQQYPLGPRPRVSVATEPILQQETPKSTANLRIPPRPSGPKSRHPLSNLSAQSSKSEWRKIPVSTRSIHVRSTSGSFDLNVSSRLPLLSTLPRVNSASLMSANAGIPPEQEDVGPTASQDITVADRNRQAENRHLADESQPRSLPHIALVKGMGDLLKTVTQTLTRQNVISREGSGNALPESTGSSGSSSEARVERQDSDVKPLSPPRPPKRSLSYQVLNAATGLSPNGEGHVFATSRSTYFASAGIGAPEESNAKSKRSIPRGYDRLYLSGAGDAALSLHEWSAAYIARVKFDDAATDCVNEPEPIPRYATLWDRFMKSSGNISSEGLRAFALLGQSENKMSLGSCTDEEESNNFRTALEISSYAMGAGGGAVTAMAFLPRDIGVGDAQLIATGDSTGSVGVYEIRTGTCQGSFGIPFPPGIPEVGISSIQCLNRPDPTLSDPSRPIADSRSALILAGAYDGRVAVFKSDLNGPKYRIMSTFQASGQSYWSKVGTSREPSRRPSQQDIMRGTQHSESMETIRSGSTTFADTVRDTGNGLVLAYDTDSLHLAAAGCDANIVRIWDLAREQCIWEGTGVEENTWPTAVTMWGRINPHVFVVGSSTGMINMVDMRERGNVMRGTQHVQNFGSKQTEPVISLGTCPPVGTFSGESVVSADIGGEIAFWDPRWNASRDSPNLRQNPEVRRIKAHRSNLTSMCVHPAGTLIASGSTARCVKVFGPGRTMLRMLCSHEPPEESLTVKDNRIPPVTSLSFQPHSNLLGIGCMDSSVIIYGQPDAFAGVQDIIA